MTQKRKHYSKQFKIDAVKLVITLSDNIELESGPGLVWMENGNYRKNAILPVALNIK